MKQNNTWTAYDNFRFPLHFNTWVKNFWQGHLEEENMENAENSIA